MKKVMSSQPEPSTPGLTKQMVRNHARRLFRDQWGVRHLTKREWVLAEQDLARAMEAEAI
jgi:hypothetical protein